MRCEAVQRELSAAMDGAGLVGPDAEAHRRTCQRCMAFEAGAWRVREATRFALAPPVPDLVPAIMDAVRREEADRLLGWAPGPNPLLAWLSRHRAPLAASVIGVMMGVVLTAGGLVPVGGTRGVARAEEIPRELRRASVQLEAYRATFDVTERHWTGDVPLRTFVAQVAFRAPESFDVRVRDTSRYPSTEWPRNDLSLTTDGRAWNVSGPDPCPPDALPNCPQATPVKRTVVHRAPFDALAPMPTDVILPMTVLAASDRVEVVGPDRVAGRRAVVVELAYQDASSLFDFLRFLGSWRPFYPQDRVALWLDRDTWFPLAWKVLPAAGAERASWAESLGLPPEPPATPVFSSVIRSFETDSPPSAALFEPKTGGDRSDQRFRDFPLNDATAAAIRPGNALGLRAWRYGRFDRTGVRPYREYELAYAKGLGWLSITRVVGWNQDAPFGVGPFAERVAVPGGGTGYYEPATSASPRRLALHTDKTEVLVATNLSVTDLMAVAGSLPADGVAVPTAWHVHRWGSRTVEDGLNPSDAIARAGFRALVPARLPSGYRAAVAQSARGTSIEGLTVVYRRPGAELDGFGIRLYQAVGQTLPPPTGADQLLVQMRGATGRWSPQDHLLEWMDGDVYRSVSGPAFDLSTLLAVADSLRSPGASAGATP